MKREKELLEKLRGHLAYRGGVPPYMIFRDVELELLLEKKPKSLEELAMIKGFPADGSRVTKYGDAIVNIFKRTNMVESFEVDDFGNVETKLKRMQLI